MLQTHCNMLLSLLISLKEWAQYVGTAILTEIKIDDGLMIRSPVKF